jgi:uncharacterized circularly permuted ATP-grasp superfamily protein/uncharacterized alpha-E superfamily protein
VPDNTADSGDDARQAYMELALDIPLRQTQANTQNNLIASMAQGNCTPDGHWDELRDRLAPVGSQFQWSRSWDSFAAHTGVSQAVDLSERIQHLNRQVRDNGITYNVYADQSGPQRPWSLDLFPLMIEPAAWQQIESGVLQRVRLLEKVMEDAYGSQHLIRQGLVPAALVQGHPDYLPEMVGVAPVGGNHLSIAAFDLTRGPDGNWWVISQRTQAPSGLGYLLENRLIVSRLFQQAFEAMPVQRLAATYRAWIEGMRQRSPAGADAHIALLTPGPYNETYFEHAYLARYLGLSLVQGTDLTVRNNRVFLKTLHGLKPVHGIIKRVDDQWMDPLEQRPDSALGIAGLLQAIRAGNVLVANAPGSGFLESGALLGFMPALSQALLGEPLTLPAAPTWWMGERSVREAALAQLHNYVIKPTYPPVNGLPGFEPVLGPSLNHDQLQQWRQTISAQPSAYTVQQTLPLAHMPTWQAFGGQGQLVFKPYMLRVYALADGVGSWRVLPGGLARLGTQEGIASMQYGGSSADVWTLASSHADVDTLSLLPSAPTPTVIRSRQRTVTSRSAENLFWLGRYSERCENTLRLTQLTLDALHGEDSHQLRLLAWLEELCRSMGMVPADTPSMAQSRRIFELTLINSLCDTQQSTGVGYNLMAMHDAAATLRERISPENWNLIVQAQASFKPRPSSPDLSFEMALGQLKQASQYMAAITGAQTDRMTRDDGWRLLSIGRHIERLDFLSQAWLQSLECGVLAETAGVEALLELFDSTITFHSQYQQSRSLAALLDLLLVSLDNPRSLGWVVKTLRGRLLKMAESLSAPSGEVAAHAPGMRLAELAASLPAIEQIELASLCPDGMQATDQLVDLLQTCSNCARDIAQSLSQTCFSHAGHTALSVAI